MAAAFPGDDRFLGGSHRDTLWEKSYMLVGMETMMMAFLTEPAFARAVLRHIMDFQLGIARHYAAVGVEIVNLSDDLGTQRGPLLGPAIVEAFLLPEYARLIGFYKARGVLINFHSCGNVASVIEPIMSLGVDILNPVQATANDLDGLRARTQGRMALQGGISSATLMDGPPDRIRAEVRQRIGQLGQHGGYFCCQDQELPYPAEHLDALNAAVAEYGRYPVEQISYAPHPTLSPAKPGERDLNRVWRSAAPLPLLGWGEGCGRRWTGAKSQDLAYGPD